MDKKDGGYAFPNLSDQIAPGVFKTLSEGGMPLRDYQECFCDRMYPDSNPNASCGDCPTRDYGAQPAPAPVHEGLWRCSQCGEPADAMSSRWRWSGKEWQHHHGAQVGHVNSRYFGSDAAAPVQVDGAGELPRYGIRWNGPTQPISVPIGDGYWTPWHLAHAAIAALQAQQPGAQAVDLYTVDDSAQACSDGCCGGCQFRPYIPHPPSIPEPSAGDVELAWSTLRSTTQPRDSCACDGDMRAVLTTYTARLRERIGGAR